MILCIHAVGGEGCVERVAAAVSTVERADLMLLRQNRRDNMKRLLGVGMCVVLALAATCYFGPRSLAAAQASEVVGACSCSIVTLDCSGPTGCEQIQFGACKPSGDSTKICDKGSATCPGTGCVSQTTHKCITG